MNIFERFFSRKGQSAAGPSSDLPGRSAPPLDPRTAEWQRKLSADEVSQMLEEARHPALHLRKTPYRLGEGAPGCWFGGKPTLPDGIDWPLFEGFEGYAIPMQYFAQINLSAVPPMPDLPEFPSEGTLFFFMDMLFGTLNGWHSGCHKVIYVAEDVSHVPERDAPPLPDIATLADDVAEELWWHAQEPGGFHPEMPPRSYRKWCLTFEPFEAIERSQHPVSDFYEAAKALDRARFEALELQTSEDRNIDGQKDWATNFVDAMMFGDTRKRDPEWVSLLKLIPDWDIGFAFHPHFEWATQFLITREDLAAGRFDAVTVTDVGANQTDD